MKGAGGKQVFVVGPRRAQNELLASYLGAHGKAECRVVASLEALPEARTGNQGDGTLILIDCPGHGADAVRRRLQCSGAPARGWLLALFNVAAGRGLEKELFPCGVKGFFYQSDGPDT